MYKNNSAKVTYEVDNQNYTVESGEYHNCMFDVGEKVDVYYKLENPEDAVIVMTKIIKYVFYGVGLVFGIAGVIFIIIALYLRTKSRNHVDMID